jgi:hypothetical protein
VKPAKKRAAEMGNLLGIGPSTGPGPPFQDPSHAGGGYQSLAVAGALPPCGLLPSRVLSGPPAGPEARRHMAGRRGHGAGTPKAARGARWGASGGPGSSLTVTGRSRGAGMPPWPLRESPAWPDGNQAAVPSEARPGQGGRFLQGLLVAVALNG